MALLDAVKYAKPIGTPSATGGAPSGGASLLESVKYARQEITPTPTFTPTPSVSILQRIGELPKAVGNFIDKLFKLPKPVAIGIPSIKATTEVLGKVSERMEEWKALEPWERQVKTWEKVEEITTPFLRTFYPSRIVAERIEKKYGARISPPEEIEKRAPGASFVGKLFGDITNIVYLTYLTAGVGDAVQVPAWLKTASPYLARLAPEVVRRTTVWGLKGLADEVLEQYHKGELKPSRLLKETAKESVFGLAITPASVIEATGLRVALTGLSRAGWATLEAYLEDRRIDSEDILNIIANGVLGAVFEAVGAKAVTRRFQDQKFYDFNREQAIIRTGLPRKEAEMVVNMLEKLSLAKYGVKYKIPIPPAIYEQIPAELRTLATFPEIKQVKVADSIMAASLESIKAGQPLYQALFEGIRNAVSQVAGKIEITPQEARDQVIGTNLEGTKLGNQILKTSLEAEAEEKNVEISKVSKGKGLQTPEGVWVGVDLVEVAPVKLEEKAVAPTKLEASPEYIKKWGEPTKILTDIKETVYSRGMDVAPKEVTSTKRAGTYFTRYVEEAKFYGKEVRQYKIEPENPLFTEHTPDAARKLGLVSPETPDDLIKVSDDAISKEAIKQGYDAIIRRNGDWVIALDPKIIKPTEAPKPVKKVVKRAKEPVTEIPKELEPLAEEARKYKSVESWTKYNVEKEVSAVLTAPTATYKELNTILRKWGGDRSDVDIIADFYTQATKRVKPEGVKEYKLTYPELKKLPKARVVELVGKQGWYAREFQERVERGKLSPGDLYRAGITIKPTDLKTILKSSPEFKKNPVLVYRKDKGLVFEGKTHKFNIFPEALGIKSTELKEGDIVNLEKFEYKGKIPVLDRLYTEGVERVRRKPPIPKMGLSIEAVHSQTKKQTEFPPTRKEIGGHLTEFKKTVGEIIKPLRFYPNLPLEFRNAVRTDVIGGLSKARDKVYNQINTALWGGLTQKEVDESVELIYARDQLSRAKIGKGDPRVSVEESQKLVNQLEKKISPAGKEAAERYRTIQKEYTDKLIERGLLDPDDVIDDYVRHFVVDYTPEWVFNKGIPSRLRRPFRGYLKKAVGTRKEIRQDSEAILGQFLSVEYDNMIEDFILQQASKYDLTPTLSKTQKATLFGKTEKGMVKSYAKPGRIYTIEGERYRSYSPDTPFTRQLFPTEEGLMALGRQKKTYLVPENIFNAFRDFSERGSFPLYLANKLTGYWKTMAITSRFPSFNLNNMIGDTWFVLLQSPEPLKVFKELNVSLNYLSKKPAKFNAYEKRLDKFIKDQDIVEATFMQEEAYKIRGSPSPVSYLLNKGRDVSQFREGILRVAYASYLLKGQEAGRGSQLVKFHNWIETEGLPETEALGKIARDILVDYGWVSKTFRRFIRGMALPFGTWYLKASHLAWKFVSKHLIKALLFFLSMPILSALYNSRNDKIKKLEQRLSENTRDRIHFVLGETPDGKIRVWYLQLPQDALIGTKIFSIAVNQANMALNGEKSVKEAAIDTLKRWGVREAKGIVYLTTPMVRFIRGLIDRKDPYDSGNVYSTDPERLPAGRKAWEIALYAQRCFVPYLSAYLREETMGKPRDLIKKEAIDSLVGLGALGIYDVNKKDQIEYEGKLYDWDDYAKIKDLANRETLILAKIENDWVDSGLVPEKFVQTKEFEESILEIKKLWVKHNPNAEKLSVRDIAEGLGERLSNSLGEDITSAKRWLEVQLERAKTPEEKKKWREKYEEIREAKLIESLKKLPATSKEIYIKGKQSKAITEKSFLGLDIFKASPAYAAEKIFPYKLVDAGEGMVKFYYPSGAYSLIKEEDIPKYGALTQKHFDAFNVGKYPDYAPNWLATEKEPKEAKGGKVYSTPYDKEINKVFGSRADDARRILRWGEKAGEGENQGYITGKGWDDYNRDKDGNIKYIVNPLTGEKEKSEDRGLYRIWNFTFYDFMKRQEKTLKGQGITSYEDMYDVEKNIKMAKIIYNEQGWCAWYAAPIDLCPRRLAEKS